MIPKLVFLCFVLKLAIAELTLDLSGQWKLKSEDGKYIDLPANVPGGIYTDLMNNNIIDDIFFGYGDEITKWVPRTNWTYYTNFNVSDDTLEKENVNIVFEGLDTFATIVINDILVGESQNMFVQYIFNVKNVLKMGDNKIEVRFLSPIEVSAKVASEQPYKIPPDCYNEDYGDCHVNMIRKMQASFSWDWGPSFPSVGIWKDLRIEAFNSSVIRYVVADVEELPEEDAWTLYLTTYFANNTQERVRGQLNYILEFNNERIIRTEGIDVTPNNYSEILYSTTIKVSKLLAKTWWPNGFGDQPLYNVTVTFVGENGTEESSKSQKVGFRKIELIQESIGDYLSFYFKINNEKIFMKGSNEIPINILPELGQNKTTIRQLLKDVRDTNMNMLRVWGGGVYESDYFYDLADEYGILIWQDFMFACALYPADEQFRKNVIAEVRHQVKRLKSHPSIALFAGNNENEGALADNWYGTSDNFTLYKKDYVTLYIDTVGEEYIRLTNNRSIFLSSSPSNGLETAKEGYVSSNPGNNLYGDVHFYSYLLDSFATENYPIPRFASEYGYQSFPSYETLLKATNNASDLDINSDFMTHCQHHPDGNAEIELLINYQFNLTKNNTKALIFYSQIIQAMSIKIETEHYRAYRGILDDANKGYTMGALYWQLNDVWVAPTWSGIDFTGKWKMLQYYVKDFFAPIIITAEADASGQLRVFTVVDNLIANYNATASILVYNYSSLEPLQNISVSVQLEGSTSKIIQQFDIDDFLSKSGCNASASCFFYFKLIANGVDVSPNNFFFPNKIKNSNANQPNLNIVSVNDVGNGNVFEIVIKTDSIALFVWLDVSGIDGKFSENGFVQVEESKTVYFNSQTTVTLEDVKNKLSITNLLNNDYNL